MDNDRWFNAVMEVAANFSKIYGNNSQADINEYYALVITLYCARPPDDDDCPIGVCPNPDVAGTLLRIARKFSLSFLPRTVI